MGRTMRGLAKLAPRTLALMHGPSFAGDGAAALRALADNYDQRVRTALTDAGIAAPGQTRDEHRAAASVATAA
jgi:hypothetical protein